MTKDKTQEKEIETYVPDWAFVTGRLDSTFKMLACPKDKYKEVTINLTQQPKNLGDGRMSHGFNYSIAKIDLHNGTYGSASKVFDDATKLAEQIAKRWNEYDSLYTENAQLREALREIISRYDILERSVMVHPDYVFGEDVYKRQIIWYLASKR